MSQENSSEITRLLQAWASGDTGVEERLFSLVYVEMRSIAQQMFQKERGSHTLQPTALVHEAFLRLVSCRETSWQDRKHFYAVAARVMRHILVDHARKRSSMKRGGDCRQVNESVADCPAQDSSEEVAVVHEALERLAEFDPDKALIVDLRFFVGLSIGETSTMVGCSERTVRRQWTLAKAWLKREIGRN